ncbi:hypothetical protein SB49_11975 [Sediminicola sp. YIK13]|uniref:glycosyltransferase family 2 protein n=1 Tax=Sediminicola sp. YIK13 TaxID=1453352 RepID=UPI00071EF43C|nr:glycosyltransferase family 2 protein [Sediminicola sp. YIK13]ALM08450.1 hypothetical protein SB49_11975 [Sediminicola sp. YIK13]
MSKIDILIPLAGKSLFFDDKSYPFPKPLIDVDSTPMIQLVIERLLKLTHINKFIFIVNNEDCKKYHIDNVLRLLTEDNCEIVKLDNETKGAACSALMAIDYLDKDRQLIICNGDQVIEENYNDIIDFFQNNIFDCGVATFESVHPRWSYVRLDENDNIIETAEKRPISKSAIAGFYYFKDGYLFIESAMRMIEKDANVNGLYYIAPCLNELVLQNKKLGAYKIDNDRYFSFYSPQKIKTYESR